MAKKKVAKKSAKRKSSGKKNGESRLYAFIASFFTIIGFLIAIILWKKDKYVMFYAKESLILFIGFLIASAVGWIPVIGWLCWVFMIVLWVMTWIYALQGQQKKTWIIGDLAEKINL